ncbi:MAG: GMC family oxidoreductase [Deltaproteobacteria bacterium]|nr:GMC family oxidoreductase [Deltaproteobacteria bacterium]
MIFTHRQLIANRVFDADVCIIGSGAGGSAAAYALAQAGRRVIVVERGSFLTPKDFDQREENMFPKLFYDAGGRTTRNRAIRVLHGHGVGGSTLHNINLCKRIPDPVFASWELPRFNVSGLRPHYEKVEKLLGVSRIPAERMNENNRLFKAGVEKLGYRGDFLFHNRKDCVGSGFCELGCAFDAKMNALRVLIPQAVQHGAMVLADTRALRLERDGRRIVRVIAQTLHPESGAALSTHVISAKTFICAGGAVETPLLLQRSDVPDPESLVGSRLHLHPGVAVLGEFEQPVRSWQGIPQSYECTEFISFEPAPNAAAEKRIWMIAGSAHPAGAASMLPGFGAEHAGWMEKLPRMACISAMVHDSTRGIVRRKGEFGADLNYVLNSADRAQLATGLREAARILLAAGAREAILPFVEPLRIQTAAQLDRLPIEVRDLDIDMVAVHPMSTVWVGRSEKDSCLDESCRYWQLDNLLVADMSVYPSSLGVPPQLSAYAIGFYAAATAR